MMKRRTILSLGLAAAFGFCAVNASAADLEDLRDRLGSVLGRSPAQAGPGESAWAKGMHTRLRLVSASTSTGGADSFPAGIEVRLDEGWKTYWRNPGDSGIAPVFDFSGSRNVAAADVAWPMPERFEIPGDVTYGYHGEVLFPLDVQPENPALPVTLHLKVLYGVCAEICVPEEAEVSLTLPPGNAVATAHAESIAHWRDLAPADEGLSLSRINFTEMHGDTAELRIAIEGDEPAHAPHLIVEGPFGLHFGRPEREEAQNEGETVFHVPVKRRMGAPASGLPLRLTFGDGMRVQEFQAVLDGPF